MFLLMSAQPDFSRVRILAGGTTPHKSLGEEVAEVPFCGVFLFHGLFPVFTREEISQNNTD